MKVNETKKEGLKREFTIIIAAKDIKDKNAAKIADIQKNARIPGFRPGKVPQEYIAQRFKDGINGETINELVKETSEKLVKEQNLELASQPKINISEFKDGSDLEYKFECEVLPEIKKINYKDIKLTEYKIKIPDSEVDKQIELKLKSANSLEEVKEKGAKLAKGNSANIDYKGFVDGKAFQGGEAAGHELEIGSKTFIDNFEDQLIGMKVGDEKKIKVNFPKEYHSEELKGKEAEFEVKLNKISKIVPAKLTEDYAKSQGFKDIKELKEKTKESVEGLYKKQTKEQFKKELFDYFEDKVKTDLPESMVETELKAITDEYVRTNGFKNEKQAREADPKKYKKQEKENRQIAERRVKVGILLSQLAKQEKIEVSNTEVIEHLKGQMGDQMEQIMQYYGQNPQALNYLKGAVLEDKVIDWIGSQVTKKEKEVTIDQFKKIYED